MVEDEAAAAEEDLEVIEDPQVPQEDLRVETSTEPDQDDTEAEEAEVEFGAEDGEDLPIILELDFSADSPEAEAEEEVDFKEDFEDEVESDFLTALENGIDQELVQAEATEETTEIENKTEGEEIPDAVPESPSEIEHAFDASETNTIPSFTEDATDENEEVEEHADIEEKNVALDASVDTETLQEEPQVEGVDISGVDMGIEATLEEEDSTTLSAYDEYLKDNENIENVSMSEGNSEEDEKLVRSPIDVELSNSESEADIKSDMALDADTKNAHVWNELGNVYFNAGSFDDAIAAYNKAIELDETFAWPYSNLAMSYVQKDRLEESVLLYQRSIELFSNEKDKAVTWNRLGNVYRRLNDYEKAIAAYQRADDLDPDNIAITQQARFSLLGSENINQELEYSV
jgi:hypothetical protein